MNPRLFGKPMKTTTLGYRFRSVREVLDVHVTTMANKWQYTVTSGPGLWLQSDQLFVSAEAAARSVEARLRSLRAHLNRIIPRSSR